MHGDASTLQGATKFFEIVERDRARIGESNNRQARNQLLEVDGVRLDQQVAQEMQAKGGVGCACNWLGQVDLGANPPNAHATTGILANHGIEFFRHNPERIVLRCFTELRLRIPDVENGAVAGNGGKTVAPGHRVEIRSRLSHVFKITS